MKSTWIAADRCGTCKFSFKSERNLICRRFPPHATAVMSMTDDGPRPGGSIASWPPVQDAQWCGEFARSAIAPSGSTTTTATEWR